MRYIYGLLFLINMSYGSSSYTDAFQEPDKSSLFIFHDALIDNNYTVILNFFQKPNDIELNKMMIDLPILACQKNTTHAVKDLDYLRWAEEFKKRSSMTVAIHVQNVFYQKSKIMYHC